MKEAQGWFVIKHTKRVYVPKTDYQGIKITSHEVGSQRGCQVRKLPSLKFLPYGKCGTS